MPEPLAILTGCVGLVGAAAAAINKITAFVRACHDAKDDLKSVEQELTVLQRVLKRLKHDTRSNEVPDKLQKGITSTVKSCEGVIEDITKVLKGCKGRHGTITWAARDKDKVEASKKYLTVYRKSLSLAIQSATLFITKNIKKDTKAIRKHTKLIARIKKITEKILKRVEKLEKSSQPGDEQTKQAKEIRACLGGVTECVEAVPQDRPLKTHREKRSKPKQKKKTKKGKKPTGEIKTTPTSTSTEINAADVEDKEHSPEIPTLDRKCKECNTRKKTLKMKRCEHRLCKKCIRLKVEEATQPPYGRPKCCGRIISLQKAESYIDDDLKRRYNQVWGKRNAVCPKEDCKTSF